MAKSTRKITREQFSDGTTIDGDRLEKALNDAQVSYNQLPLSSIASMTSKQINWGLTAAQGIVEQQLSLDSIPTSGYMYGWWLGGPLETVYDGLRNADNYLDPGATPIQNFITYKGTGKNIYTNRYDNNLPSTAEYKYRWENSYLTHKPCIIKELSFMGMWDDGYNNPRETGATPLTQAAKYYNNDWQDSPNPNISGFEVLIAVDNNLSLATTVSRDNELRVWSAPANNFMVAPWGNTTDVFHGMTATKWNDSRYCGEGEITPFPTTTSSITCLPAGIHVNLRNLEIPVHEFGRIRIVLVLPKGLNMRWDKNNTIPSSTSGNLKTTPSCFTNMWSASMTILEELDSE